MKPPPRKKPQAKKVTLKTELKKPTLDVDRLERKATVYLPGDDLPWKISSVVIVKPETKLITDGLEQTTEVALRLRRVIKQA
jgi:hypothetical protein